MNREPGYYWIKRDSDEDYWEIAYWHPEDAIWLFCEASELAYNGRVHAVADRIDLPSHLKQEDTSVAS